MQKFEKLKKFEARKWKKGINPGFSLDSLEYTDVHKLPERKIDRVQCKQAICLVGENYCGLHRMKIDKSLCKFCPSFDRNPPEYRAFRRT